MSNTQYLITDYSNQGFGAWFFRGFRDLGIETRERHRKPWMPSLIKYPEELDWL